YKHDIGENKKCVEVYQGRDISFMTDKSLELLKKVNDKLLLVPTTTRTNEQYGRIDMGLGVPKYALTCNGGVLLVDGVEDEAWYNESRALVQDCDLEIEKAASFLEKDVNVSFEIRVIKQLFLFTKSDKPEDTIDALRGILDLEKVDVFSNGVKVYVVPKTLSKGKAIDRFRKKMNPKKVIAAGDSEFDITMLDAADIALAPVELQDKISKTQCVALEGNRLFSEELLEWVNSNIN
ncbi:MAG: HAD family hydrolase, partial [Lachnospiraceae bacterium]|nr:HAD family hydrolase [Lachnospiraceae bacterium]